MNLKKYAFVIFTLIVVTSSHSYAQKIKKDTIYYLADTSKTPPKDRMLVINTEVYSRLGKLDTVAGFRINCACLPYGFYPTFTRHYSRPRKQVTEQEVQKLNFISLSDLLKLVLRDYEHDFHSKHVVVIVEAIKNNYFFGEVYLTKYNGPVQ